MSKIELDDNWDGAGALPFCVHEGQVLFLFQETKGGRKEGKLVDFGGGRKEEVDFSLSYCAAREFAEETAGLFTSMDPDLDAQFLAELDRHAIEGSAVVLRELPRCLELVEEAEANGWIIHTNLSERWYAAYAIRITYSDLSIQRNFFGDALKRKVRQFHWIPASVLFGWVDESTTTPSDFLPPHQRVTALINLKEVVQSIVAKYSCS